MALKLYKSFSVLAPVIFSIRVKKFIKQSNSISFKKPYTYYVQFNSSCKSALLGFMPDSKRWDLKFKWLPSLSRLQTGSKTYTVDDLRNLCLDLKNSLSNLTLPAMYLTNAICINSWFSVKAASYFSMQKNFIADIVEKAGPAVVFIEIKGSHPISKKRVTIANGSGFLVRPNGLILTNAHVVANKSTVNVRLYDGTNYQGTVITLDPVADLATVKIDTDKRMSIIPLGKSSTIRPGEFVAAMGSPLSLHKTATIGIVSSYLRGSKELGMSNSNMEYIQTDATIGLGNSGGPLVNLDGQAIGINTLKLTEGISFAIPADYALPLLEKADQLISRADVPKKPKFLPNGKDSNKAKYVGFTMLPLTPAIVGELREKHPEFPENVTEGIFIHKVVVSSPAYSAGLHAGDIIISINGKKVASSADVYTILESSDILHVMVYRGQHKAVYKVNTETL